MSEKRFKLSKYVTPSSVSNFCDENGRMLNKEVVKVLNEQQSTIQRLEKENKELGKNFVDLVEWASEIAKRNVLLDERIGRLQQAIRIVYEKKPYPTFEDIQNEINNDI